MSFQMLIWSDDYLTFLCFVLAKIVISNIIWLYSSPDEFKRNKRQ